MYNIFTYSMEYKNIFGFNINWNTKSISMFIVLLGIPNMLGMLNISTPFGFKIHFFQAAIILAALIYGPIGGLMSGITGSMFSAILMNNPYIIIGNAILGFFTGIFLRYGVKTIYAVLFAYLIQLPWLVLTDYYLVHLPWPFIQALIIALLISNTVWALVAHHSHKPLRRFIGC